MSKGIASSYTLGKNERLKSRKLIEQLFADGKSLSSSPLLMFYLISNSENILQAGFSVSSKTFKKAVNRNRIKRLMREAYRLQKDQLQTILKEKNRHLAIFFIYTGKEVPDFELVSKRMNVLLKMLSKNIEEQQVT